MCKFFYNDIVRVRNLAKVELRPGDKAWIVGIEKERRGSYFERFPPGIVYAIEYEDGFAADIHEADLEPNGA